MGSCVSVHKDPASVLKLRVSVGPKNDKIVIPSPIKEKPVAIGHSLASAPGFKPQPGTTFRDFGSKEETFFDSQPWLESDCEDDFFSVNGDFTPSRGNTPVHHSFSAGNPRSVKSTLREKAPTCLPEPSPKKRLSDLFKESMRGDQDRDDQNAAGNSTDHDLPPKSVDGIPYVSGALSVSSSDRTTAGGTIPEEKSVQCCLPRVRSNRSYNERKKKTSPAHSFGS